MPRNPHTEFQRMLNDTDGFDIEKYMVIKGKIYAIVDDCKYHVDDLNIFQYDDEDVYYYCIKTDTDFYYDSDGKANDDVLTDALNEYFDNFPESQDDYYETVVEVMEDDYVSGYADYYDGYEEMYYE